MLPPAIDSRDLKALIEEMKKMAPYYTPEWRFSPEDPDPGTALFMIFAQMFQETIKRFNQVPLRNFMAFLNMLDLSFLPSRPAMAFLTFKLSTGTENPVFIPAKTQVLADAPDGGEAIIFETEKNMMLTPAALVDAYLLSRRNDIISRVEEEFMADPRKINKSALALFDFSKTENLQEHSLLLGHKDLFNIQHTALMELELSNSTKHFKEEYFCKNLANAEYVEWSYGGEDEWFLFDEVRSVENRLLLKKSQPNAIYERVIEGMSSRWIKCRIKNTKIDDISDIAMDGLALKAKYFDCNETGGLTPDMLFFNDIQLDIGGGYPFGDFFSLYDTFYLSSQEVLSKKGATVSLAFSLREIENLFNNGNDPEIEWKMIMKDSDFKEHEPLPVFILKVSWEYWNGSGWIKLFSDKAYEEIFSHPSDMKQTIRFECPLDMEETFVNDQFNYWIRARILSIHNMFAANVVYYSPWIENITMEYEYLTNILPVQHCLTYNNLEYCYRSADLQQGRVFRPFYATDTEQASFYMGFNRAPVKGPVSIFFSIRQEKYSEDENPLLEWEYLSKNKNGLEWSKLNIIDETKALTVSGIVTFVGPQDFARSVIFAQDLYWIRIVNRDGRFEREKEKLPVPLVNGIYINTTRVIQQESIENEILEKVDDEVNKKYQLSKSPVISAVLWIDEKGHLTAEEMKFLQEDKLTEVREIKGELGNSEKFWVRWEPVEDFFASHSESRHYRIDYSTGEITFGDGRNGKIPPSSGVDNIVVEYKTGGGIQGNVDAFEISKLQNSIAFVNEVFNPEPSGGGCNMETLEEAMQRGPQMIKSHHRAVTVEDFEWLSRQASQNIARVKCLPNRNLHGRKETACVTLVILPKGGSKGRRVFPQIKQEVERYLMKRTANNLLIPGKINVIEPVYIEISVYAIIGVNDIDAVALAEQEAIKKLDEFLESRGGSFGAKDWEIGQYPHISVFYTLLKSISSVNYVEKVSMTVVKIEDEKRMEIDPQDLLDLPHGIVVNGKHRLVVKADY